MRRDLIAAACHPHITSAATVHLGDAPFCGSDALCATRIIPHQRGFSADANTVNAETRERSGLGVSRSIRGPGIGTRFGTRGLNIGPHRGRSTTTAEFPAPTCVLKGSDDDDVEDRRHDPCCASDGGRSSGVAVQAEIPNHRRLRRSRAGVVSAAVDVSLLAGRVCDEKTNMCEPLLTHRNETTMASKPGSVGGPGTKARCGGPSVGELPVCGPDGARCIGGVSSSQALAWNRRTCRPDRDGRCFWPQEGEPQAANTASGRVPMRGTGADRPVVAVRAL